jgi:D-alanine-D-alanine ligase
MSDLKKEFGKVGVLYGGRSAEREVSLCPVLAS